MESNEPSNEAVNKSLPKYRLSRHATERMLERSHRAPAWILGVLENNQFVCLQFGRPTLKKYLLIHDPVEQIYLVAILGKDAKKVVTVLTATQYENVYGAIEPVFFKLAQLARTQEPKPEPPPVTEVEAKVQELDMRELLRLPDAPKPGVSWRVYLRFSHESGIHECEKTLDSFSLETWIRAELMQDPELDRMVSKGSLELAEQVELVTRSAKFQKWLITKTRGKKEDLSYLVGVFIRPRIHGVQRMDITPVLARHMA